MGVTDDSQFFMSRDDRKDLVKLLRQVPDLIEDLTVALTRQDRIGSRQPGKSGDDTQPLPINLAASDATDCLHHELASWARLVCTDRDVAYDGTNDVLGIAAWLDRNIISLAMTEGSEEALVAIRGEMEAARRACDRPAERYAQQPSEDEVEVARQQAVTMEVTPSQAEAIMPKLGHPAVKAATIRQWHTRGKVEQVADGRYRLGDLLDLNPRIQERMGA